MNKNAKLLYATSITYPSILANRIQTLEMSKEFSKQLGFDNFILGGRDIIEQEKINVKNIRGSMKSYFLALKYLFLVKNKKITHIFCREEKLLFFMLLYNKLFFHLPIKFIYEAHWVLKNTFWYLFLLRKIDFIMAINNIVKEKLVDKFIISKNKILVASNGVNLKKFDLDLFKEDARERLNLPLDKKIILYTGHLYDWKGAQVLADSSQFLKKNIIIIFVGGRERDIISFRENNRKYSNVLILGSVLHQEIPFYLKSADILLLPNIPISQESINYTSPIKMFEYMASKRPIIASDLPSIREILNENNSILVEPDSPQRLAQGISELLGNEELMKKILKNAYVDVQNYTWERRVKKIINFINK